MHDAYEVSKKTFEDNAVLVYLL